MADWKAEESPPGAPQDRRGMTPAMTTEQAAAWIFVTCRAFGAEVSTSHKVAGFFAEALEQNRREEPPHG